MPIKSFTFAFKLDAKELLEYVVNRNMAVDIHATGTKRTEVESVVPPLPALDQQLALPAPKGRSRDFSGNSRGVVLMFMAQHPKENYSYAVVRALLEQTGYSAKSVGSLLDALQKAGWVKKSTSAKGGWRITAKGLRKVEAE
jgi:hypothetical protein